jgi:glycosyltransferase involved in cell wall biosynthesis
MPKLLSIIIPTLNRPKELEKTLASIAANYPIDSDFVEFILCDNASLPPANPSEATVALFKENLRIIRFGNRVEIDQSFARCINQAQGKYIQIFGDDDIAIGSLGFQILHTLIQNPNTSILYVNRLIGDQSLSRVSEIAHPQDCAKGTFSIPISEFIKNYNHWPSFIPSIIFSSESWNKGFKLSQKRYPGYNFLDIILRGSLPSPVILMGDPLLIQRRGIQTWKKYWPQYWLQAFPEILKNFDLEGITKDALSTWIHNEIKIKNFIVDLLIARSLPSIYKRIFWRDVASTFNSSKLSFITNFIRILPPSIARLILSTSPNSRKYNLNE